MQSDCRDCCESHALRDGAAEGRSKSWIARLWVQHCKPGQVLVRRIAVAAARVVTTERVMKQHALNWSVRVKNEKSFAEPLYTQLEGHEGMYCVQFQSGAGVVKVTQVAAGRFNVVPESLSLTLEFLKSVRFTRDAMALTRPERYDIKDSNIALLGSDLEKHVREHAADKEPAWEDAGKEQGLCIWRIENFKVISWPKANTGLFYDGDSYIVLHTYKKSPDSDVLAHDLHFWLGENTTQDEAGTAAYKTVELDDHLHGAPVQYREVQNNESDRFLSYFPKFQCLKGGVATGFHHVTDPPPLDLNKLYRISASKSTGLVIRQVTSLGKGDVFVLDKGSKVLQFNTKASVGKEKFKAAEFVQSLVDARQGQCSVTVYDEGGSGSGIFLAEFGGTLPEEEEEDTETSPPTLFRLSDATGKVVFEQVNFNSLSSSDVFLLDDSLNWDSPAVYVWLGRQSSLNERRLAGEYAQRFLHDNHGGQKSAVPVIRMREGDEAPRWLDILL